ncbi:MAG: alcohol dehydrogenase catalytic domain-containing protein, partial [Verrucomicrobia bacterium]|nr:alcohol dehydrogenase catalytic domain-containing protein [Verrucomicrobiota bacterium]
MKAAIYHGNRTVGVGESVPVPPMRGEVRLEVAYCGICGTDIHIFHGHMDQRVETPLPIGHEVSATVAEVGEGVTDVAV